MNNIKWKKYIRQEEIQIEKYGMSLDERIQDLNMVVNTIDFKNKKILDIGCEEGIIIDTLQKNFNCDVTGLTLKKENDKKDYIIIGDMHELPFDDDTFDIVLLMHTLEHSVAPYIVLNEINRILKNEGKVVIIMPEEGDLFTTTKEHYMTLTFRQLFNLLYKNNFIPNCNYRKEVMITDFEEKREIISIWEKSKNINDINIRIIPVLCGKIYDDKNHRRIYSVFPQIISSKILHNTFLGRTDSLKLSH